MLGIIEIDFAVKVENVRIKQKLKRIGDAVSAKSTANGIEMDTSGGGVGSGFEVEMDYDDIGRDFILSGGSMIHIARTNFYLACRFCLLQNRSPHQLSPYH